MADAGPVLNQPRSAGLLASVAVYPLSRLAGTLPRPTLDRALMSGVSMAVTFQAAVSTTQALRRIAAAGSPTPRRLSLRTAVAAAAVTGVTAGVAVRTRRRARAAALDGHRLGLAEASTGSVAEVMGVAAGATALVALADVLNESLPSSIRPTHPALRAANVVAAGAVIGVAARHARLVEQLSLPTPDGVVEPSPGFQRGATVPVALGRSAAVALGAVAALSLETRAAHGIASLVDRSGDEPGPVARLVGHGLLVVIAVGVGTSGFAFYSSRVAVQERLLEAAYAAVPERSGITGGPDSAYAFTDLGREGRRFVSQAHTADEIVAVLGGSAVDPVRAWVPLAQLTGDVDVDAAAVVGEVERLGGFTRSVIVLSAPTGDGYVSYVHTETVELLTAGDCTTVAVPYAAVPSALALPKRDTASAAYAAYARAVGARARELNPNARLFAFGESLGSIIALDAFGPDFASAFHDAGFSGGLYCGVPIYSRTDRVHRPAHPSVREQGGLQYATGREQALTATPGHVNLTHPTDPVAIADPSTAIRHPADYWGRPHGVHVPLVSFLAHLFDVKNAMNLRPGEFTPSPGHDYRYDTAAAVARAYALPFDQEDAVEAALRERELAWSVRRLLSKRIGDARDSAVAKLRSWGVDPVTVSARFRISPESLPAWLTTDSATPTTGDGASAVDPEQARPDVETSATPLSSLLARLRHRAVPLRRRRRRQGA